MQKIDNKNSEKFAHNIAKITMKDFFEKLCRPFCNNASSRNDTYYRKPKNVNNIRKSVRFEWKLNPSQFSISDARVVVCNSATILPRYTGGFIRPQGRAILISMI